MEPLVDSELLARAAAIAGRGELPSPRALPSACPIPLRALSQAALPPSAPRNDAPNPPLPSSVALHVDHAFFDDSDDELAYVDPTPHRTPAAFPSARFAERGNRVGWNCGDEAEAQHLPTRASSRCSTAAREALALQACASLRVRIGRTSSMHSALALLSGVLSPLLAPHT